MVRALWPRVVFKQTVRLLSEGVTNLVHINESAHLSFGSAPGKLRGKLNDLLDKITDRSGTKAIGRGHRRSMDRGLT